MAPNGREHWRRAVAWTFAGIFAVSLLAGLLAVVTRGALAVAPPAGHAPHAGNTTAPTDHGAGTSSAVSPQIAAVGEAALLQLSNLPAGWVASATTTAPARVSPWSTPLARCVGVKARHAGRVPTKVDSPDFTSANQQLGVEDSVSVYATPTEARADYAAMANPRTTRCMNAVAGPTLEASMQHAATAGTTIGHVSFSALPAAATALHETGFTVSIPVAASGRVLAISSTQVDFVRGSLLHQVTFNGNGTTFPGTLELELLAAARSRS
jgi:hypothetical protein